MVSVAANLTAEKFLKVAGPWLEEKEVQNSVILGLAVNIAGKPAGQRQEHHFWAVKVDGAVVGAAVWTPPYKLSLTEMPAEAITALARKVKKALPQYRESRARRKYFPVLSALGTLRASRPCWILPSNSTNWKRWSLCHLY